VLITPGYGLTETAPVIAINGPSCSKFGSVGPLVPLVDVRIDPETGEIQAKGPNIVEGYFNKPKQTAEAFTEDGWFRTGDVGRFDEDGYLYITDRIKDLIITSGGKNIAPQMIESLMTEDFFIEYIAIIGDRRNYITALVVPSFSSLEDWAKKKGLSWSSREELVAKPEVVDLYRKIIDERQKDLGRVEQIKKFTLLAREFSQEAGEITPP
jgi:long-chain acyl-CoA synthetase